MQVLMWPRCSRDSLDERPRGAVVPRSFPPGVVVEIKALACELPARLGLPLSRLSIADLRAEALQQGLVATISETTIWRWLAERTSRDRLQRGGEVIPR